MQSIGAAPYRSFVSTILVTLLLSLDLSTAASSGASEPFRANEHHSRDTSTVSGDRLDDVGEPKATQQAKTWRERFANKFLAKVKARQWSWIRKRTATGAARRAYIMNEAKQMRRAGQLRLLGKCYRYDGEGYCYIANGWVLTLLRGDGKRIVIENLTVED